MKKPLDLFKWGYFKFFKCIFGILLESLAVNLFVVPNHLYTGGILGVSQLIRTLILHFFDISLPIDISTIIYYLINIPLFIIAYKNISKTFFVRTIFTVSLNTFFLMIIPIPSTPLISELLTNVLIGGIFAGIGLGMVLSTGSSSGGTDIIGVTLSKKKKELSVGNIGWIFNVAVYSICGLTSGIETMIYSVIYASFESVLIDRNHSQNIPSLSIVFTKKFPNKMIGFINEELNRDATYWEGTGGYTKTKTYIVFTALSKYERMRLERHMNEFDEKAFIVCDDGVYVKGEFAKNFLNT